MSTASRQLTASRNFHNRRYLAGLTVCEAVEVESLVSQEFLRFSANFSELKRRNPAAWAALDAERFSRKSRRWQDMHPEIIRELERLDAAEQTQMETELRNA